MHEELATLLSPLGVCETRRQECRLSLIRSSFSFFVVLAASALLIACSRQSNSQSDRAPWSEPTEIPAGAEFAYFAAGCFWCSEEIFQQAPGVISVVSGYMGGSEPDPTYEKVGSGRTGYAESIQVAYDPARTSYEALVDLFWHAHDPTQLNRQGPDVGRQYRSAIFYRDEKQRTEAEASKAKFAATTDLSRPVATEITAAGKFYPAEEEHQNFYRKHPDNPYVRQWLVPKLRKLGMKL